MFRSRKWVLSIAVALLFAVCPQVGIAEIIQPVREVKALTQLQNDLARGKQGGSIQGLLIQRISAQFRAAPPTTWSDRRNAIAAVKYLISGGDPSFAATSEIEAALPAELRPLFKAALAYAQGAKSEAREQFSKLEPRELDPMIAGHVALVRSLLIAPTDVNAAMTELDEARLLGLGTLVEEAALRRQIGVLVHRPEPQRFQRLSLRYVRQFQRSIYSAAFRENLAAGLLQFDFTSDADAKRWLSGLIDQLGPEVRALYCLLIAERALIRGRRELVRIVSERVRDDAGKGGVDRNKARLLSAAVSIVDPEGDVAFRGLRRLTDFPAGSFEADLQRAALAVFDGITMPVVVEKEALPQSSAQSAEADVPDFPESRDAAIAALKAATKLLAQ